MPDWNMLLELCGELADLPIVRGIDLLVEKAKKDLASI